MLSRVELHTSGDEPIPAHRPRGLRPTTLPSIRRVCVTVDEGVRCELRLDAHHHREAAAAVSNLLLAATLFGACVGAAQAKRASRPAWHPVTAHALAVGLTLGLGHLVKESVARPRPFERDLAPDAPRARTASFYSLHSAVAFASAGFACALRPPRGSRAACMVTSGAALAMAGATGALRVVSDRHYLTDVVVGAAMGLAAGLLMPMALLRA